MRHSQRVCLAIIIGILFISNLNGVQTVFEANQFLIYRQVTLIKINGLILSCRFNSAVSKGSNWPGTGDTFSEEVGVACTLLHLYFSLLHHGVQGTLDHSAWLGRIQRMPLYQTSTLVGLACLFFIVNYFC